MALNATRQRLMKEKANYDVDTQCTRYDKECKNKGSRHLTPVEMTGYIMAYDKDKYLESIGKLKMEGCN